MQDMPKSEREEMEWVEEEDFERWNVGRRMREGGRDDGGVTDGVDVVERDRNVGEGSGDGEGDG